MRTTSFETPASLAPQDDKGGRRRFLPSVTIVSSTVAFSRISMFGFARTAAMRVLRISWPVASPPALTIRRRWCAPSRPSSSVRFRCDRMRRGARRSSMRAGASWVRISTMRSSLEPAPARCVSIACSAGESSATHRRSDPTLRPIGCGAGSKLRFAHDCDTHRREFERSGYPRDACSDDDDVCSLHCLGVFWCCIVCWTDWAQFQHSINCAPCAFRHSGVNGYFVFHRFERVQNLRERYCASCAGIDCTGG